MKIIYKFDDGSTSEVEVDEELGAFISAEERKEENAKRKYRYRFIPLDTMFYEGMNFADEDAMSVLETREKEAFINEFLKTLTPIQRERLARKIESPDISFREIARIEGTSKSSVVESFDLIRKKYEKFLKKHLPK